MSVVTVAAAFRLSEWIMLPLTQPKEYQGFEKVDQLDFVELRARLGRSRSQMEK